MNATDKVLSQPDSAKLVEICNKLGIMIETERVWMRNKKGHWNPRLSVNLIDWELRSQIGDANERFYEILPAPDSDELLEIMPVAIKQNENIQYFLEIHKLIDGYLVEYESYQMVKDNRRIRDISLVQALFKMVEWLAEKGLIGK